MSNEGSKMCFSKNRNFVIKKISFIIALSLFIPISNFAGPQTLKSKELYVGYGASYSDAQTIIPDTYFLNHYLVVVFGLTGKLDLYSYVPYTISKEKNNSKIDYSDFSDGVFGFKAGIYSEGWGDSYTLSLGSDLKVPMTNYSSGKHTSPGDGQKDLNFYAQFGKNLFKYQYFYSNIGYRFRFQDPADQFHLSLEYSVAILKTGLAVALTFAHTQSLSGKDIGDSGWSFTNVDTDYSFLGYKISYSPLKNLYLEFTQSTTIQSNNVSEFNNYGFHIGYLFN